VLENVEDRSRSLILPRVDGELDGEPKGVIGCRRRRRRRLGLLAVRISIRDVS
jgi:hypothetical protein